MQTRIVRGVATSIRVYDGYTIVNYGGTDVVKFNDDEIILNNGGWITLTTCVRMNQASNQFNLGYSVYRQKGKMFICNGIDNIEFTDNIVSFKR